MDMFIFNKAEYVKLSQLPTERFTLGNMRSKKGNYQFDLTDATDSEIPSTNGNERKPPTYRIPFYFGLLLIGVLLSIWGIVIVISNHLPTPILLKDEATYPYSYNAESAQQYLKALTDFGPRVTGSYENEVLTVEYLKGEINKIINQSHSNQRIELDVQVASGAFDLDNPAGGRINVYRNVQNVVVKLYSENERNKSLLLNVHFDSVPTSTGATDDGINCASLLEIMRKLSKSSMRPLHNIIFLFNGAEETALQASHGFITQHKWAKEVEALVNVESAGSGGKLTLFQTGPNRPWTANAYKDAPHPSAQAIFEEMFQANLVPSDTDFRIFRDFGGLHGLDLAFLKDGYRYHTKFDNFDNIPLASYQHSGDNIMSIIMNVMDNPELSNLEPEEGNVVYFDYMGAFYIIYSTTTAYVLNILIAFFSVCVFLVSLVDFKLGFNTNTVIYLSKTMTAILSGWILAAIIVYLLALFYDGMGYPMSWFANPWLVFGLYVVPNLIGISSMILTICPSNFSPNVNCQIQIHITRLIWTIVLFAFTVMGIRSAYILSIYVLFNTLPFIIIHLFRLHRSVRVWQVIYFVLSIIPTLFLMNMALDFFRFYIPINGRIGNGSNPELFIGFASLAFTLIIMSQFISFIAFLRKSLYLLLSLGAIFIFCFIVIFTPLGFPYSGNPKSAAPQRFWILHSQNVYHGEGEVIVKQESGFSLLNMDRNSPRSVKSYVPEIESAVNIKEDCEKYLCCGIPLAHPKMYQALRGSSWIPAGRPIFTVPTQMTINSRDFSEKTRRFNITVSGPDRLSVFVSPRENVTLTSTNLLQQLPAREGKWNGRPYYYIIYVAGKKVEPLEFTLDFEVSEGHSGVTMDIAVSGIYVHEKRNKHTPEYHKFLSQFPDWADLTAWLATYETWAL